MSVFIKSRNPEGVATTYFGENSPHQFIIIAPDEKALIEVLVMQCGIDPVNIDTKKFRRIGIIPR